MPLLHHRKSPHQIRKDVMASPEFKYCMDELHDSMRKYCNEKSRSEYAKNKLKNKEC